MESISSGELIELALTSTEHIHTQFQYWLSITFALIVACFVAKDQLRVRVRVVLAILYLATTLLFSARLVAAGMNATLLTNEILARGLEWTPGASPMFGLTQLAILLFGVCAALWFLYATYESEST